MIKDKKVKIGDLVGIDVHSMSPAGRKIKILSGSGVILAPGDNYDRNSDSSSSNNESWVIYTSNRGVVHVSEKFIYEL